MVLSPMMQILSKLAQQFGPDLVVRGSDLLSSSGSTSTSSSAQKSSTHFKCPKCNHIGNYGDVSAYSYLICKCQFKFPCVNGTTRCTCGKLLAPANFSQEVVGCDVCFKTWKTKSNLREFGDCKCKRTFEIRPGERHYTTDCCNTVMSQLKPVVFKTHEPRVPSEAERNR